MGIFEEDRLMTASETGIMHAVWSSEENEDISIPDLIERIEEIIGIRYARTTVVTFLLKLSDKGMVRTYRKGKLSYAHALMEKEEYRKILTRKHLEEWYSGDVDAMMGDATSKN